MLSHRGGVRCCLDLSAAAMKSLVCNEISVCMLLHAHRMSCYSRRQPCAVAARFMVPLHIVPLHPQIPFLNAVALRWCIPNAVLVCAVLVCIPAAAALERTELSAAHSTAIFCLLAITCKSLLGCSQLVLCATAPACAALTPSTTLWVPV